jgi:hypothetical protein
MSFLVTADATARAMRIGAVVALVAAYVVTVFVRVIDAYKLWPGSPGAPADPSPRGWRKASAEYAFFLGVATLGILAIYWLAF